MSDSDWLGEPEDVVPPMALVVATPDTLAAQNVAFASAWGTLSDKQQMVIRALRLYNFNISKTLRELVTTGDSVHLRTFYSWKSQEAFAFALKAVKAAARAEILDADRIHLRLDEIAEGAIDGTPILFQGQPTGFYEKNYTAALKATELQMKATKMLGEEKESGFNGRNITLAVQVVMPSGETRTLAPRGVVIDVPAQDVTSE